MNIGKKFFLQSFQNLLKNIRKSSILARPTAVDVIYPSFSSGLPLKKFLDQPLMMDDFVDFYVSPIMVPRNNVQPIVTKHVWMVFNFLVV